LFRLIVKGIENSARVRAPEEALSEDGADAVVVNPPGRIIPRNINAGRKYFMAISSQCRYRSMSPRGIGISIYPIQNRKSKAYALKTMPKIRIFNISDKNFLGISS